MSKIANTLPAIDIFTVISEGDVDYGPGILTAVCPVCKSTYNHVDPPYMVRGNDNYESGAHGRGDLSVIPLKGECGSHWEICAGFHKGQTQIFARLIKSCEATPSQ
ncbi:MAG: hypothetical protein ACQKBU_00685 [Verrucomicrobiales bacterium]